MKINQIILISILMLAANSCAIRFSKPKELECKMIEQACNPAKWHGIADDTSVAGSAVRGYYYSIERVKGINSSSNEWSLSFLNYNKCLLTYSDGNRQNLMLCRTVNPSRFMFDAGISAPVNEHLGAISVSDNFAVFASSPVDVANFSAQDSGRTSSVRLPEERIPGNSNLYSATIKGNQLTEIKKLSQSIKHSAFSWESQPALSNEKNVVFFASDRDILTHGTDLYFIFRRPDGKWSEPINCKDSINSNCDELTPYLTPDGKILFFASNGHETVGGYDLFSAEINPDFWDDVKKGNFMDLNKNNYFSRIKNLRPPVNTMFDELFPSSPEGNYDSLFYYSSNQIFDYSSNQKNNANLKSNESGGFDIFVRKKITSPSLANEIKKKESEVEINIDVNPELKQPAKNIDFNNLPTFLLEGFVYRAGDNMPLANAEVTVRDLQTSNIKLQTTTNHQGLYQIQLDKEIEYEVTAQSGELFFDSYKVHVDKNDTSSKFIRNFYIPEILTLRINFPTDEYRNPYKFTLDSNGVETNHTWLEEIELLASNLIKYKGLVTKIMLVGHTDDVGTNEYNFGLGKRRVQFVIEQLIARGVPAELLESRSAGESEPLIKLKDEDINNYRKKLRRVTLEKVMKK